MELTAEQRRFLEGGRAAIMTTLRKDGTPHSVRVGVALVDGKLWSSGTQARVRTGYLRGDPRSTVIVLDSNYGYLTIESTVTILEGPDAARLSVKLFRTMQRRPTGPVLWNGKETDEDAFVQTMADEQRLIYQFDPRRIYGFGIG
jgi:PPOX class probable F420-dependent enzyme